MAITEDEIIAAIGRPVTIERGFYMDGVRYFEFTAAPDRGLWKHDSEDAAKADLIAEIVRRAEGHNVIRFRVWPETKSRPDGKASGFARAAFHG